MKQRTRTVRAKIWGGGWCCLWIPVILSPVGLGAALHLDICLYFGLT